MTKHVIGKIVRFDSSGVGVVDVPGLQDFVYFRPKHIHGYKGETVHELATMPKPWKAGQSVSLEIEEQASLGEIFVQSVDLA